MKVPLSWLREYVDVPGSPADVAKLLVFAGVGVEAVEGEVLELEITANRADLLSMLGVARDVAVLRRTSLKSPDVAALDGPAPDVKVEVREPALCGRYLARRIRGVKIGPSPAWLASKLEAAGIRPVNNVVDVTNFVLLECGQATGVLDVSVARPERPVAKVRPARVSKVLGMSVPPARVREILQGLGAQVSGTDAELAVTSPAGRRDLKIEVDYIEEVARVEGYEKIPLDTSFGLRVAVDNKEDLVREEIRATLTGLGAYEVLTWSFAKAGTPNRVAFWTDGPLLPLRDPQGNVDRTLRESLAPGLLEVLKTNEDYKEAHHPVFEIARVYLKDGRGYGERAVLGLALPGDPLGVKGFVDVLASRLGLALEVVPAEFPFLEPGSAAELRLKGSKVGYLGSSTSGGLRSPVATAELDFAALAEAATLGRAYREFPRQPPVERDLSIALPDATAWRQVEEVVRAAAPATLESIRFLSEYRGAGIPSGQKGWAFSMTYRAADRTLSGGEVDQAVKDVAKALQERLGARQR
jgi:phenylalanyl-tRNA synthetase beta chain